MPRDDRGEVAVNTVIFVAVLTLLFLVVEAGVAFTAHQIARGAARQALDVARLADSSATDGEAQAEAYLEQTNVLQDADVSVVRTAETVTATVTGETWSPPTHHHHRDHVGARRTSSHMTARRRTGGDAGSALVEFPIMATVFIGFLVLLGLAGHVNNTYAAAESAARYSARELTLASDPAAAAAAAEETALATVAQGSSRCESPRFDHTIGPDSVEVTVTCTVDLSGLGLLAIPRLWTVSATAEEPLDQWREIPGGFSNSEGSSGPNSRVGGD